ncbi:MAG TPA: substrate-binding domain-containing protein [Acetobacteraceae bacterium]|nr:substrate-binding domain-containing protein [Acetobacteraceae bacterium]
MILHLLAAGASKGLVSDLQARFAAETGAELAASFMAAGAVRERFQAGDPCDVVILTAALLDQLSAHGLLDGAPAPIGMVRTGIAVPAGKPVPNVETSVGLRKALLAARGIYVPDPQISTAGVHFMRVVRELGIQPQVMPYLRPFPNGATAMHNLAKATEPDAIGCTQITEIKYTPGLTVAGPLPEALGLATVYAAAVAGRSVQPDAARRLVTLLTGPESLELRQAGGFEVPSGEPFGT